jgi:hypothetical protein
MANHTRRNFLDNFSLYRIRGGGRTWDLSRIEKGYDYHYKGNKDLVISMEILYRPERPAADC